MLKKIAALAVALSAAGAAQADQGPVYVTYPGFCNVKAIYMANNGDLYGQEIGCSAFIGAPMVGFIAANGSFIFSTRDGGLKACMNNYLPNGTVSGGCSTGLGVESLPVIPYGVSFTRPRAATNGASELPRAPY